MSPCSDTTVLSAPQTITIKVSGMHCANCVQAVEAQLLQQPNVISATVDLADGIAVIQCTAELDSTELVNRLTDAGFPSQLQTTEPEGERNSKAQTPATWMLQGFLILVVFFNLCLNAQVLSVGLAYFYNPEWWQVHVWLVRGYSGLSLVLVAWVYQVPFPRRVRNLTASMPVLLGLQFLTIHLSTPIPIAILHPLIGFTVFSVSTTLVHRVGRFISPRPDEDVGVGVFK